MNTVSQELCRFPLVTYTSESGKHIKTCFVVKYNVSAEFHWPETPDCNEFPCTYLTQGKNPSL